MSPEEKQHRRIALETELSFVRSTLEAAPMRLSFEGPLRELNERLAGLNALGEQLARARARGYVWGGDLEGQRGEVQRLAGPALELARGEIHRAANALRARVDSANRSARAISGDVFRNERAIQSLASDVRGLDNAIDAAETKVRESTGLFARAFDAMVGQLKRIHETLDAFEQGSFKLQPEENPLAVIKATWEDSPQGKKEGLLLLTAHRIRFEAIDEVVLERSLIFFASRTEKRRTLLMDAPVGYLSGSDDSERGLIMKDQLLILTFRMATGGFARCTFEVEEVSAKEADSFLEQIRSGDLERQRYRGAMPTLSNVGVPVRWPESCNQCGARLEPPVRGQTYLTCAYCNAKHDVVLGEG
ncbi:MAG: hypothetical protein JNK72_20955 [Myxococcales bacterium]|nr:hypothetical protein [Myxococcales bacterium]